MRSSTAFVSAHLSCGNNNRLSMPPLAAGASIQEFNYWQYVSANSIQLATSSTTTTAFEPILPDASTLIGFGILTLLCVICALVWSNEVVPISRSKLAISKSRGQVRVYLDDLKAEPRPLETWLMSDWLTDNKSRKQPAIPMLKRAKWNSGDNPVVVTAAMMMVGIVVASVTERIAR